MTFHMCQLTLTTCEGWVVGQEAGGPTVKNTIPSKLIKTDAHKFWVGRGGRCPFHFQLNKP